MEQVDTRVNEAAGSFQVAVVQPVSTPDILATEVIGQAGQPMDQDSGNGLSTTTTPNQTEVPTVPAAPTAPNMGRQSTPVAALGDSSAGRGPSQPQLLSPFTLPPTTTPSPPAAPSRRGQLRPPLPGRRTRSQTRSASPQPAGPSQPAGTRRSVSPMEIDEGSSEVKGKGASNRAEGSGRKK